MGLVSSLNFSKIPIELNTMFGKMEGEKKEKKLREGKERKWKKRENFHPSCCLVKRKKKRGNDFKFFLKSKI